MTEAFEDFSNIPAEWEQIILSLAQEGLTTLVLGGTDAGKTTFCRCVQKTSQSRGLKTAIVDADVGQSTFGLPGTVALCCFEPSDENPAHKRLYFVGDISPRERPIECLVATVRATQAAWEWGASVTIVDTTGYVSGPGAVALKTAKIEAIRPEVIVALAAKGELDSILGCYVTSSLPQIIRLPPSFQALSRSREQRRSKREAAFRRYFAGAVTQEISLSEVILATDLPLGSFAHQERVANLAVKVLGQEVLLACECDGIPLLILNEQCGLAERDELASTLGRRARIYYSHDFHNCLGGALDSEGEPLGVVLLNEVDWRGGSAKLLVPPDASLEGISILKLGRLRVDPNGVELGYTSW